MQEITIGMREKGINNMERVDREEIHFIFQKSESLLNNNNNNNNNNNYYYY